MTPLDADPPRLVLASLSGESDAEWACGGDDHADAAVLGGVALDGPTRAAARAMVEDRDRTEFLPPDPVAFAATQLDALADAPLRAGVNVRATGPDPVRAVARECAARGAVLEVNAHCRQEEMCAAGAGESLLRDPDRLAAQVAAAADAGATVSVKVRAELDGVDLPTVARRIEDAGGHAVHVDAMDTESAVRDVAEAADLFVIANNGVRGRETAFEYLEYGADAVSVGRPSDDPRVLRRVRDAVDEWFDDDGDGGENGVGESRHDRPGEVDTP